VLAPFRARPLIRHVLESAHSAVPRDTTLVVATSTEASDDPLAVYVESFGVHVFRGPLDDVFERFRLCAAAFRPDWVLRLNADSPFISAPIVHRVLERRGDCDIVTTTFPRSFPQGLNAELLNASTLRTIDGSVLTAHDREHVTAFFYRNAGRYRIVNVHSATPSLSGHSLAIDTLDDLRRLEAMPADEQAKLLAATVPA
jgi:spore coat polysaccharide biosynthesis protein SpsF